jgi:hypothetical protein
LWIFTEPAKLCDAARELQECANENAWAKKADRYTCISLLVVVAALAGNAWFNLK